MGHFTSRGFDKGWLIWVSQISADRQCDLGAECHFEGGVFFAGQQLAVFLLLHEANHHQQTVAARFAKGIERMDAIEQMILENQKASLATATVIAENMAITREMKDAFDLAKTGLRVIGVLGTVAKWVARIAKAPRKSKSKKLS